MENIGTNGWGVYTIPSETNLKQYYIKGKYTDEHFGTGKVIAPMEGTSGNERFYVMALENFDSNSHSWYYNANGHLDNIYSVNEESNDFATAGAEPTGRINTERMIESWNSSQYGAQISKDMWGVIQEKVAEGWFVPSKSEWATFGETFGITSSNYANTFGLDNINWSSSQKDYNRAYHTNFINGRISHITVDFPSSVRLATTF